MSGGQFSIPIVVRGSGGPAHQLAAQHSQSIVVEAGAGFAGMGSEKILAAIRRVCDANGS